MVRAACLALLALAGGPLTARDLLATGLPPLSGGWKSGADGLAVRVTAASQRLALPSVSLPRPGGSIRLDWTQTAGKPGELRAGLVFGGPAADTGWYVLLRGDGLYWFGHLVSGRAEIRLTGALTPPEAGQPMSLELSTTADRLNLVLDGTPLSLPFDGSHAGTAALWVAGTGALAFTRIQDGGETTSPPTVPTVPTVPGGTTPPGTNPTTHDPLEHTGSATGPGTTVPVPAVPVDPIPHVPTPPTTPTVPTPPVTPPTPPVTPVTPTVDPPTTPPVTPPTTPPVTPTTPTVDPPTTPTVPTPPVTPPTTPTVPPPPVTPPTTPTIPTPPVTPPTTPTVPTPPVTPPTVPTLPTPPTTDRAVLFSDDFDPPKHNWNRDDFRRVDQGGLRLRSESGYQLSGFPYDFGDLRYSGRVRALSAGGGTYGLVARLQRDGGSGYVLVLRDPDTFAIARVDQGKATILAKGACTLHEGDHTLVATLVGSRLSLAVDGVTVGSAEDSKYTTGGIGVWVDNRREALFDDLLVTAAKSEDLVMPPVTPPTAPTAPTTPPTPPAPPKVLFQERFAAPKMSWQQDAQRQFRDGALHLKADDGRFTVSGVAGAQYTDYRVVLEGERVDGPDGGRWGLIVRLQPDGRSGYLLAFSPDGTFVVLRMDPNGAEPLGRGATTLSPGSHHVWGRCSGGSLTFGVDDTELLKVQDATYGSGGFGGYVDNGAHARLGELTVEALP